MANLLSAESVFTPTNYVPIMIFLQYEKNLLKFQVNPEKIWKDIPSKGRTTNIEGLGEVNIPQSPSLATMSINSFFWQDRNYLPTELYVAWLEKWQKSKKPAKLIITRLNYSMYVTCERFFHEKRAGEEDDVYYELDLKEYRQYGAKRISTVESKSIFDKFISMNIAVPVLVDIPNESRINSMKSLQNPYITKEGDTLSSIARKFTGTSSLWKKIYDANENVLGDIIGDFQEIPVGTSLIIPKELL